MRCLLLKAFLVMLTLSAITFGQDKSDTQLFRFAGGGPNNNSSNPPAPTTEADLNTLAAAPGNAFSHYDLGMKYYKDGDFDRAAESFRRVTEILPNFAVAYNQLGVALLEAHRDKDALQSFLTALKLKPGDPVMMVNAGFIYVRLGKFKEAIAMFEAARGAKEIENYEDYYVNLGFAYANRKRYKEAVAELRRGIEINPTAVEPQYFLGIVYLWSGQRDFAIKQQKVVEQLDPEVGSKLYREMFKDKLLFVSDRK